jgi:integrase
MQNIAKIQRVNRRTLKYIEHYPRPYEIYDKIVFGSGWSYKTNMDFYLKRDRAMVALLYLLAARISEVLRLKKSQFIIEDDKVIVRGIKLSKSRIKDKPRREQYRQEAWLPLTGKRAKLTQLVLDYLEVAEEELFISDRSQAWKITIALIGEPCHWLRAYGENYLYDEWDKDILAVADYVKVDPRTLQLYIRSGYKKYKPT